MRPGGVKSNCEKLRKIAGKLRCRNQTSRSLKEQHLCTGDTQGTNKQPRWTNKKQLRKNCGKLREIGGKWEIVQNCEKCGPQLTSPPPPPCLMA